MLCFYVSIFFLPFLFILGRREKLRSGSVIRGKVERPRGTQYLRVYNINGKCNQEKEGK